MNFPAVIRFSLLGSVLIVVSIAVAQDPRLATLLERFPAADTDKDGTLTVAEATDFLRKRRGGNRDQNSTIFVPGEVEMKEAIDRLGAAGVEPTVDAWFADVAG